MVSVADYEELGRIRDLPADLRDDAVRAARIAASAARMLVVRAAFDAGDTVLPDAAVIPSSQSVGRGIRDAIRRIRDEARLKRDEFRFLAFFGSLPFIAFASAAMYPPLSEHPFFGPGVAVPLIVTTAVIGCLATGARFALGTWRLASAGGPVEDITEHVSALAGESWLPGDRALHIARPGSPVRSVPYHEIGMVCVHEDEDGLSSVVLLTPSAHPIARIAPSGDGSRSAADELAETIRIKTMASLVV